LTSERIDLVMLANLCKTKINGKEHKFYREGGVIVNHEDRTDFLKEVQTRFEKKVKENEISILEHWKEQLDRILAMKPEGIASLQLQVKKTSDMMANRIKTLKKA